MQSIFIYSIRKQTDTFKMKQKVVSAKSGTACFKNVFLFSVSWNEPRWCFALEDVLPPQTTMCFHHKPFVTFH